MKLISSELEKALQEQENNPHNIPNARRILEQALQYQLSKLSDGILAWLLLHDVKVDKLVWWHHYLTYKNRSGEHNKKSPSQAHSELTSFRQEFAQNLAASKIKVINEAELNNIRLRIYGGWVKLWDTHRVNSQLSKLGSAYRLAFIGEEEVLFNEIINILDPSVAPPHLIDSRFIFGKIGFVSALPFAQLLDFETEVATSPTVKPTAPGFCYEDRIVMRRQVLDSLIPPQSIDNPTESTEYQKMLGIRYLSPLMHESFHVFESTKLSWHTISNRRRFPYILAYWREDTKQDISRFAQIPRAIEEIRNVFKINFENFILQEKSEFSFMVSDFLGVNLNQFVERNNMQCVLDEMIQEGLLVYDEKEYLYCPIYDEGRRWEL